MDNSKGSEVAADGNPPGGSTDAGSQDIDTTRPNTLSSDVTTPTLSTTHTIQETTPTIQATPTNQAIPTNIMETPVTTKPHPLDDEAVTNNITTNNSTPDHTPTLISNETLGNDSNELATPTYNESYVYPDDNDRNDHDDDGGSNISEEVGESPEETPPSSEAAVLRGMYVRSMGGCVNISGCGHEECVMIIMNIT